MITQKIKALFQFIEYLHSNIENFNHYNGLIMELETLNNKRNELEPGRNYKDKLQYDKVQAEIENKFKTLQENTANLIKAKAKELNLCNFDNAPIYNFNGIINEIHQLKNNFIDKDLSEIFKHKSQYIEYRMQTHKTFLSLQIFFNDLDVIAKNLFDYFKDTQQNEFEAFETKAIPVNSIAETIQGFKKGQTKFTLPGSVLFNTSTNERLQNEALPPQQTETKTPTAPAIALLCNLINDAGIIKRENDEIPEKYCKRICEKYSLKYTDRVRQNFNGNKSKKHYKELTELILPCIDKTTKDKIQKHLDSKNPPKQKLYA